MKATLLAFSLAYYESVRTHEETAPETEPVNEAPDFVRLPKRTHVKRSTHALQ